MRAQRMNDKRMYLSHISGWVAFQFVELRTLEELCGICFFDQTITRTEARCNPAYNIKCHG